jgi:hypothetical protein
MTSRRLAVALSVLALLPLAGPPVLARQAAPRVAPGPAATISPAERDAVLAAIAAAVRESYVFPERRAQIVERLEQSRKAGRYDVGDAATLADRLTEDLRAASNDRHMYVSYDPAAYAAARSKVPDQDSEAFNRRMALRDNHGLTEQKILPGNIRYLKISAFEWVRDETGAAYDAAMRFARAGDAVIIDLRGNPGGSHAAVRYLLSHFMDEDVLDITFLKGSETPTQSRTLDYLPAGRLKGKPLYVLIDGGVGSAAEAFAYDVQQFKLGQLVGAKTAGAANNNTFIPVAPAFMFSVSFGRPVHPVSQSNWEAVGVSPTVPASPPLALEVAQLLALDELAKAPGATPEALAEYAWARTAAQARLTPATPTPAQLQALAGRYGEITIALRDGRLWMTRAGRPDRTLSPLTADGLFAVDGSDRLRVRFTPKTLQTLWMGDPNPRVYPRD